MKDEEKERAEENCEELSNAWNPDEGIALEWWDAQKDYRMNNENPAGVIPTGQPQSKQAL